MSKPPTLYRKRRCSFWFAVVRTAAGRPLHQCTRVHRETDARWWAAAKQRDIARRAADAQQLFPTSPVTPTPNPQIL